MKGLLVFLIKRLLYDIGSGCIGYWPPSFFKIAQAGIFLVVIYFLSPAATNTYWLLCPPTGHLVYFFQARAIPFPAQGLRLSSLPDTLIAATLLG